MSGEYNKNKGVAPGQEGVVDEMQSQNLAGGDPGKAKKIYLHWTAGGYNSVVGPYHTIFTGDGTRHLRVDYNTRSGHTYGRNTGAVGLSVAAMAGGHGNYQWPKEAQLDAMAAEAARLGKAWGWTASDINLKNIMTHGEAGSNVDGTVKHTNYGPFGRGRSDTLPEQEAGSTGRVAAMERWDLDMLNPKDKYGEGGNKMRDKIRAKMWRGGFTKSGAHKALLGERGREFVIDSDSTQALEVNFPGFLDAINRADGKAAIQVLKNYASYENRFATSASQIVPIAVPVPVPGKSSNSIIPISGGSAGSTTDVLAAIG